MEIAKYWDWMTSAKKRPSENYFFSLEPNASWFWPIPASSTGVGSIIVIIGYIIGMLYKLYMIHKGTYTEEEPVFLKYK